MRLPKTKELNKKAFKYTRKRIRKRMIALLKSLKKVINKEAKQGRFSYNYTVTDSRDYSWEMMVVFRWFRRYSKLNVKIEEEVTITKTEPKYRYIDSMYINVNWA